MGARAETRCQKTSSVAGARGTARPRARAADDLSAQGSGLRARQTKGGPHAPEVPTPTPVMMAVNLEAVATPCRYPEIRTGLETTGLGPVSVGVR